MTDLEKLELKYSKMKKRDMNTRFTIFPDTKINHKKSEKIIFFIQDFFYASVNGKAINEIDLLEELTKLESSGDSIYGLKLNQKQLISLKKFLKGIIHAFNCNIHIFRIEGLEFSPGTLCKQTRYKDHKDIDYPNILNPNPGNIYYTYK